MNSRSGGWLHCLWEITSVPKTATFEKRKCVQHKNKIQPLSPTAQLPVLSKFLLVFTSPSICWSLAFHPSFGIIAPENWIQSYIDKSFGPRRFRLYHTKLVRASCGSIVQPVMYSSTSSYIVIICSSGKMKYWLCGLLHTNPCNLERREQTDHDEY